ncbi:hypothetical protein [uncultured Pontibacter sp.]|nr:hypothetical protein [uncultured Pontibacter sp.]
MISLFSGITTEQQKGQEGCRDSSESMARLLGATMPAKKKSRCT